MNTSTRPEISPKSQYWIDRHRYYELKHFCLQYPQWKTAYAELDGLRNSTIVEEKTGNTNFINDPTVKCVEQRLFYYQRMRMIEQAAVNACPELSCYILQAVTEGVSYEHLKSRIAIPCCRDVYYKVYRRFFWLLDRERR